PCHRFAGIARVNSEREGRSVRVIQAAWAAAAAAVMNGCAAPGAPAAPSPPAPSASACVVEFENTLSPDYVLKAALFTVDRVAGAAQRRLDDAALAARAPVCAYDGPWLPGQHPVELTLVYRGRDPGRVGDDRYRLFVRSRHTFDVSDAGPAGRARVVAYEKGGPEV